jgi:hypothetical protein
MALQITIGARDPGKLAAFWAEALGYVQEEDSPEYLEQLHASGHDPSERAQWEAAIIDPAGMGPRVYFEGDDAAAGTGALHLDLTVGRDGVVAEVGRLEALGARRLPTVHDGCTEMADPEGNRFCIQ